MRRRILVGGLALVILAGIGYGVYTIFDPGSSLAEGEQYVDRGAPLPSKEAFDALAGDKSARPPQTADPSQPPAAPATPDPVAMLAACLTRYQREAKGGFTATLEKHEQVGGKLRDPETIRLAARHEFPDPPDAPPAVQVRMVWKEGTGPKDPFGIEIRGTLYDQTADPKHITTFRPKAPLKPEHSVDVAGSEARGASRYCIRDGGLYRGMLRTYEVWKARQTAGELTTEYLGKQVVEKAGKLPDGRPVECHVIRRLCKHPELDAFEIGGHPSTDPKDLDRDGFTEVTIYIDVERWLQVGTVIRRTDVKPERLIGEYYFRDIELNPVFPADTFTAEGLKAATK